MIHKRNQNKTSVPSLLLVKKKRQTFRGRAAGPDAIYKTVVVKLPVLVPGACAPPRRIECPCLAVLRADAKQLKACKGKACVLYLHGNGTDIGGAAEEAKTLARELDCHVLVPEYPGYGLAEGESSEDSVDAATHSAVRFAVETLGVPHERLVIHGRSVGTGPAAAAARRRRFRRWARPRRSCCTARTRAFSSTRGKKRAVCSPTCSSASGGRRART